MTSFNPFSIAFDAWRVTRGNPEMLVSRQQKRLSEQGLAQVVISHSPEPPMRDTRSGKFRNIHEEMEKK